jgi:hypothetical protein
MRLLLTAALVSTFIWSPTSSGSQTPSVDPDVEKAERLLADADHCSLEGVGELQHLLRRYGRRGEPELRLISAKARMQAGGITWFRGRKREAERWFRSVLQLYGEDQSMPFQRIRARAKYMLARTVSNQNAKAKYFNEVISEFAITDDVELLSTVGSSLYGKSDLAREAGELADAEALRVQASKIYSERVIPRLPAVPEVTHVCV